MRSAAAEWFINETKELNSFYLAYSEDSEVPYVTPCNGIFFYSKFKRLFEVSTDNYFQYTRIRVEEKQSHIIRKCAS
ncbi:hypothetical protein GWI33_005173 [Rhynchophorus ferrugineus]|uniref:Uncharacterized protein n=1 Tax=Rhynchophorus ferrugineus TaxID=354439 RepID=A0A834MI90_RHYFE|nr:hypothetical protein GWI33_005173 [Rhynchophorus ferrugineus]